MTTLKEKQKQEALKRMKALHLNRNVIYEFEELNIINYSERQNAIFDGILYWIDNNPQFKQIIQEFEKEYGAMVYHAQLTYFNGFGQCLALLYVSKNKQEWEMDLNDLTTPDKTKNVCAYVANVSCPEYSEFGYIGIESRNGGISRVY